mgnify:CR=1 FL=1
MPDFVLYIVFLILFPFGICKQWFFFLPYGYYGFEGCNLVQELIKYLKHVSPGHLYATAMSPPAVQQVISALKVILGEDGSNRGESIKM